MSKCSERGEQHPSFPESANRAPSPGGEGRGEGGPSNHPVIFSFFRVRSRISRINLHSSSISMKTKLTLLLAVFLSLAAHAADDLSTALQKGLFEEEANQNLPASIQAYQSLLASSDAQRKLAATALFRLGECYRKLGQTNDAVAQYQRLVRDYADQTTLATLSRQNLTGLGKSMVGTEERLLVSDMSPEAKELERTERIIAQLRGWDLSQLRKLIPSLIPDADFERLDKELTIAEAEWRMAELNRRPDDEKRARARASDLMQEILGRSQRIQDTLQKRAASLKESLSRSMAERPAAQIKSGEPAPTDEEEKEIRRIQALIKDSPDLINAANVEVTRVRSGELMVPKNGTLLHKAASLGQLQVAKHLLEHGADFTSRAFTG